MRRGNHVYEVQEILDESVINFEMHYLIKWKNLGHQYDTWEPISSLKSIQAYLKFWVAQKRQKDEKRKTQKTENFKSIKSYLPSESFLSKKKIRNAKYAEQILTKKKTWQRYIDREDNCINIDDHQDKQREFLANNQDRINEILYQNPRYQSKICEEQEIFEEQEIKEPQNANRMEQEINVQNYQENVIDVQVKEKRTSEPLWNIQSKKIQEAPKVENVAETKKVRKNNKENQKECQLKVVGQIDMRKIDKIVRTLEAGQTKVLQVKMRNGQTYFVKEDDVRKINPNKLLEYYEDEQIAF